MKYLFDEWGKIEKLLSARNVFLFLDYDGTLASIAEHPDKAILSDEVRVILHNLVLNPRFKVAVISGRSLEDIKSRVGINGIVYSGNHGLQIESPEFKYESNIASSYKILLGKIKTEIEKALSDFRGIFIEDKQLSLAIHYRLAEKKKIAQMTTIYDCIIANYINEKKIRTRTGKMVFEILPPVKWNKGSAVSWILNRPEYAKEKFFPIYFGDDITDEDAFQVLRDNGLTVLVGSRQESHAQYFVNDVSEVGKFANQL